MKFFNKLVSQIVGSTLGIYLAISLINEIKFYGDLRILFLIGIVLGCFNFFLKPFLKLITLPLRILTLGLFNFVINIFLIFLIVSLFPQLIIPGIINLFLTSFIVSSINIIVWSLIR